VITSLGLGGAEKLLLTYLKNLDGDKYNLKVCCLRDKPNDILPEVLKYAPVINLSVSNRFNPIVILRILKLMRETNPDIIHSHLFQSRVFTALAFLFYRKPILVTQKHSIVNLKKHNIFILFEMLCIRLNKRVIAISESVKKSLQKYELIPENKIYVLPNCVDFEKFSKSRKASGHEAKEEIIIGTVGRLEKEKGINYLLYAIKIMLSTFPNLRLHIVGDGAATSDLKKLSKKLNISNSVIFFGKFADVIPFYNKMDIFVLPSILEGFGIVLLEAMAAGVPIVATNVNGISEVVVNMQSGLLVPPKNPKAIADAVQKLIENPHLSRSLAKSGLQRAMLFDVKEHVRKLDNFYSNLLGVESYK